MPQPPHLDGKGELTPDGACLQSLTSGGALNPLDWSTLMTIKVTVCGAAHAETRMQAPPITLRSQAAEAAGLRA